MISVKLKDVHLLGIDHKSADKNFTVIFEGEDQSKINEIINTLKKMNVPNDGLKEYVNVEILDIENDIKQVDEIPGAITLNINTKNTNKDEIRETFSKTFNLKKVELVLNLMNHLNHRHHQEQYKSFLNLMTLRV